MEKIRLIQNAATFTSDLKVDEIIQLQKQDPAALAIIEPTFDGGTQEVFRIAFKNAAFGEITENYMVFVDKNVEGKACLTVLIPANLEDKAGYLFDKYAVAINMLKVVERKAKKALENIVTSKENFASEILDLDNEITLSEALEGVELIVNPEKVEEPTTKGGK